MWWPISRSQICSKDNTHSEWFVPKICESLITMKWKMISLYNFKALTLSCAPAPQGHCFIYALITRFEPGHGTQENLTPVMSFIFFFFCFSPNKILILQAVCVFSRNSNELQIKVGNTSSGFADQGCECVGKLTQ